MIDWIHIEPVGIILQSPDYPYYKEDPTITAIAKDDDDFVVQIEFPKYRDKFNLIIKTESRTKISATASDSVPQKTTEIIGGAYAFPYKNSQGKIFKTNAISSATNGIESNGDPSDKTYLWINRNQVDNLKNYGIEFWSTAPTVKLGGLKIDILSYFATKFHFSTSSSSILSGGGYFYDGTFKKIKSAHIWNGSRFIQLK